MFGQQMPDIREGDTLAPGIPVADVLDLSELEVVAKVGELDRANLHEGQDVRITLDAVPAKQIHGRIKGMSGTASANVFSGDPAKKFDVVFGIDMKQLLTELGVKPAEVQRILETAQRNASKAPVAPVTLGGGAGQGRGPGNTQAQAGGAPGAPAAPGGPGAAPGAPFAAPMPNMPGAPPAAGGPGQGAPGGPGGSGPGAGGQGAGGGQGGGGQRGGGGGGGRRNRGDEAGTGSAAEFVKAAAAKSKFSEADLANAKLPPPPEESTQLDVLLRPGLLADVEIIVEKIPGALHVPVQAVFEKEGKPIVYVQKGSHFEARGVQIAKRSESTMVLAGGVKPDEVVALADPFSRRGGKKDDSKKGGSGNPMGGMPAGGGGGK
jgi:HlyD family secretion protein